MAAWLCPLPMCCTGCGVAANEVLVTGVMCPGMEGDGDGIDPVGVTDGLQAVPLQKRVHLISIIWQQSRKSHKTNLDTESSKEFPAAMMTSWASL